MLSNQNIKVIATNKTSFQKFQVVIVDKKDKVLEIIAYGKTELEAWQSAIAFQRSRMVSMEQELTKLSKLREVMKDLLDLDEPRNEY